MAFAVSLSFLTTMNTDKYAFQATTIQDAIDFLGSAQLRQSRLYKSPTGSGKSYMIAGVKRAVPGGFVVAPSHEIIAGIYNKAAYGTPGVLRFAPMLPQIAGQSEAKQRETMESKGFWTTKRLYNELQAARVPIPPYMIFDESHHVDDTHGTLWALTGFVPLIGFTATDYRGTPVETQKLRDAWPDRRTVLTLRDAVDTEVIALPNFITWPLLNDHEIDVVAGEFVIKQVDNAVRDKLGDVVERVSRYYDGAYYDRATALTFSSVAQCRYAHEAFNAAGLPSVVVVGQAGDWIESDRQSAFLRVTRREAVLIQVAVVGEGVDLPLRRMIDLAPTMSPMRWMQRVGRVTRPTEEAPEYIVCNHNFTRHSYLWAGVVPTGVILQNQQAWPDFKPSRRDMARAIGIEGFGRFEVSTVPLADGLTGSLYCLQTRDGLQQYAAYLDPRHPDPFYFEKRNELTGELETFVKNGHEITYNKKRYGKWKQIDRLPDVQGAVSVKADRITPPMLDWWKSVGRKRGARYFGLDETVEPTNREFQILPILANSGVVL